MGDTYIGVCKICNTETDLIYGVCQACTLEKNNFFMKIKKIKEAIELLRELLEGAKDNRDFLKREIKSLKLAIRILENLVVAFGYYKENINAKAILKRIRG